MCWQVLTIGDKNDTNVYLQIHYFMTLTQYRPKLVTKRLLGVLQDRARNVISSRYGLGESKEKMTLESIGKIYGITRERVRQIENYALDSIRNSEAFRKEQEMFQALEKSIHDLGGVISEEDLLKELGEKSDLENHLNLFLVLSKAFKRIKEDEHFKDRWYVNDELSGQVHEALHGLYKSLSDDDLILESEMINLFLDHLKNVSEKYKDEEVLRRWLRLSKKLDRNPLGEWGIASSNSVKAKGIRDLAYLAIRRHGSPMHFTEVARVIGETFGKKAHIATCHNELIKDDRFVLVGRGLYALKEWGYMSGIVREVIEEVINKNGPLSKDEIIEKVLKERYVKPNTILVNIQNPKYFKKDKAGKYSIA